MTPTTELVIEQLAQDDPTSMLDLVLTAESRDMDYLIGYIQKLGGKPTRVDVDEQTMSCRVPASKAQKLAASKRVSNLRFARIYQLDAG